MKSSSYYQHFAKLKETIIKDTAVTKNLNPFYSKKFEIYFIEYLLVYYPIWSAVGIKVFELSRDSNVSAENGFKITKHFILKKELKVLLPRLISKVKVMIRAKLLERRFGKLSTLKQKENNVKSQDEKSRSKTNTISLDKVSGKIVMRSI